MIDRIQREPSAFKDQVEQLTDQMQEMQAALRERLGGLGHSARNYIVEHPGQALGMAFGLGVCLGWLIKRR